MRGRHDGDRIAFRYLYEGCECRAQVMIEHVEAMKIDPGRTWALCISRKLSVPDPLNPRQPTTWNNHVAATVQVEGVPHGVLVIDPSLSKTGPMTLHEWASAMRVRSIEASETPLTQAQIMASRRRGFWAGDYRWVQLCSPSIAAARRSRMAAAAASASQPTRPKG